MSRRIYLPDENEKENEKTQTNLEKEIEKPTEFRLQKRENEDLHTEYEK